MCMQNGMAKGRVSERENGQAKMSVQPNRNKHHLNRIKKWPFMKFIKFNIQTLKNKPSIHEDLHMNDISNQNHFGTRNIIALERV